MNCHECWGCLDGIPEKLIVHEYPNGKIKISCSAWRKKTNNDITDVDVYADLISQFENIINDAIKDRLRIATAREKYFNDNSEILEISALFY